MTITVKSMATSGVDGFMVEIEASTIRGQQQLMSIIGLPDQAVREAGERIQAAIESCGYAKGIDSYAHTAALKKEGYTISVLGNGVDICYPKEHERLYEEIMLKGCVLSEYPPETMPREFRFPKRIRLIAALSDELYVVDAGRHSGTETTIKACEFYKRTVTRINP